MALTFDDLKGAALDAYNQVYVDLKGRAMKELGLPQGEILDRGIIPTDVGLTNPYWTYAITGTAGWQTLINAAVIADNRFVGINGISYDEGTPLFGDVEITRSAAVAKRWNVQRVPMNDDGATLYADDPVTVGQNESITVRAYNGTTSTDPTHVMIFNGVTVERRGLLLAPLH